MTSKRPAQPATSRLAATALVALAVAVACLLLAFHARSPDGVVSSGGARLAIHGTFLLFDLLAIAAGITVAALRRSPAWALVPAAAILAVFAMLFPAFEAFQAVRG